MGSTTRVAAVAAAAAAMMCPGLVAGAGAAAAPLTAAVTRAAAGKWGTAIEVPGTAALNNGNADATSVSCGSAGNCTAAGQYDDSSAKQAFVDSQVGGKWDTAIEVPGTATLNAGGAAGANAVSCASAGNCSVGGFYTDSSIHYQAFVDSQVGGKWGAAIQVPGTATLNAGGAATITSVSCRLAGSCSAVGGYIDGSGHSQVFVVSKISGKWGTAIEMPGIATLNHSYATVWSVSCASAGNCSVGGQYTDGSGHIQAFVDSQVSGKWGTAVELPGTATLNAGGDATANSVSCASPGNCSAAGQYHDGSGHEQAFVVSQVSGKWGTAIEVPGTATLNAGGSALVTSVSCRSEGNCSAGGSYYNGSGHAEAFVDSQVSGKWGTAIEVPGIATLNAGGGAGVNSVSCGSAGKCSVAGYYTDSSGLSQAWVDSQS
jgi:hypothetical protein